MITFVTGGARSGKSSYAESIYKDEKDVVYIATSMVSDEEMKDRIEIHKSNRPDHWRTFESYANLDNAIGSERNYILDCITVMVSNIMFEQTKNMDRIDIKIQKKVEDLIWFELKTLIEEIRKKNYNLVIVTNEVGLSIVPEHHISRVFRDIQGRINQKIGKECDEAYLIVSGLSVKLK